MRPISGPVILLALVALGAPAAGAAPSSTLALKGLFVTDGLGATTCPTGVPATECFSQTAKAPVRGLGTTTLNSSLFVQENGTGCPLGTVQGTLAAGAEGTVSFAGASSCVRAQSGSTFAYSFTGGTGAFAGATGSGTITYSFVSARSGGTTAQYSWDGTLVAPGYSFDTTPPVFSGIRNKVVTVARRATRARVRYAVKAHDDRDGPVRATCRPASGARFRVGRTTVHCSASDSHANVSHASFRVIVRRRS